MAENVRPGGKPKPPPYPRPVDLICTDEAPLQPADIAYYNSTRHRNGHGNVKSSGQGREVSPAKRRRIESHASAYLRGQTLYIMSAQLKGPLDGGWHNPWAKRKAVRATTARPATRQRALKIPETVFKLSANYEVGDKSKRKTILEAKKRNESLRDSLQEYVQVRRSFDDVVRPSSPVLVANCSPKPVNRPKATAPDQIQHTKIEDWLRKNEAFERDGSISPMSSPTRAVEYVRDSVRGLPQNHKEQIPRISLRNPRAVAEPLYEQTKPVVTIRHAEAGGADVHKLPDYQQNEVNGQLARLDTMLRAPREPSDAHGDTDHQKTLRRPASPKSLAQVSPIKSSKTKEAVAIHLRAERSITDNIRLDNNSLQINALVEDKAFSPGMTEVKLTSDVKPEGQLITDRGDSNTHVASSMRRPLAPHTSRESSRPALVALHSTNTTDLNTIDLLPSAQRVPELVPSLSSGLGEDTLHEVGNKDVLASSTQASDRIVVELVSSPDQDPLVDKHESTHNSAVSDDLSIHSPINNLYRNIASAAAPAKRDSRRAPMFVNTPLQQVDDKDIPITTAIKSRPQSTSQIELPRTAIKARSQGKKKTSFAVDLQSFASSHSSIQGTITGRVGKRIFSPPTSILVGKRALSELSPHLETQNSVKGVLKQTQPPSSSAPDSLRRSKILLSSSAPDKQNYRNTVVSSDLLPPGSGQNKVSPDRRDGEAFNLDAAIGDLGSFLGTWDVDKEAASLVA